MNAVEPELIADECVHGDSCPLHAENPPFNAVTLAAMQEARDMMSGKTPTEWYHSIEEAREDFGL
jgi:hypothetical protein